MVYKSLLQFSNLSNTDKLSTGSVLHVLHILMTKFNWDPFPDF